MTAGYNNRTSVLSVLILQGNKCLHHGWVTAGVRNESVQVHMKGVFDIHRQEGAQNKVGLVLRDLRVPLIVKKISKDVQ